MRIGELAANAGCDVQTIRYYERTGLLPGANRTASNYRTYAAQHLQRLQFIRRCRSLGMTVAAIRILLELYDAPERSCEDANRLIDRHLGEVEKRLAELASLQRQLRALRRQCRTARRAADCAILSRLRQPSASAQRGRCSS